MGPWLQGEMSRRQNPIGSEMFTFLSSDNALIG